MGGLRTLVSSPRSASVQSITAEPVLRLAVWRHRAKGECLSVGAEHDALRMSGGRTHHHLSSIDLDQPFGVGGKPELHFLEVKARPPMIRDDPPVREHDIAAACASVGSIDDCGGGS